jgi:hypothetical protein
MGNEGPMGPVVKIFAQISEIHEGSRFPIKLHAAHLEKAPTTQGPKCSFRLSNQLLFD